MVGPDPDPPFPRLGGVQPAQRLIAARARRLVQAHIALDRIGEVAAERRTRDLVLEQLRLGCQRESFEVVPSLHIVKPRAPERVGGKHIGEPGAQLLELLPAQLLETNP